MLLEHFPKGLAVPQQLRLPSCQGNPPAPELDGPTGDVGPARRQIRYEGSWVAVKEVVDAMAAGVHPRNELGPCNGTLGRNRGAQGRETTRFGEALEVGELPF